MSPSPTARGSQVYDVAVVGGGPAGATCAAFCAQAGLRTLLLEREKFPREKVCGDCLNPACWPTLRRLDLEERLRAEPHRVIEMVEFIGIGGQTVALPLPTQRDPEIVIKRSILDQLLLVRAEELGADVREEQTVTALEANGTWQIETNRERFAARNLVAADGRNSSVARLLKIFPRVPKERVALQAHVPLPANFGDKIILQLLPEGYSGQAPVNDRELNVCLVGRAPTIGRLRDWAARKFHLPADQTWRSITPLTRPPMMAPEENLYFVGDVARVVEPFTGEGIFYAIRSGELAAQAIVDRCPIRYAAAVTCMYRGRLWVNRLARAAVLSPRLTSALLRAGVVGPQFLQLLTAKVVR